jgi:hypothetical protein
MMSVSPKCINAISESNNSRLKIRGTGSGAGGTDLSGGVGTCAGRTLRELEVQSTSLHPPPIPLSITKLVIKVIRIKAIIFFMLFLKMPLLLFHSSI